MKPAIMLNNHRIEVILKSGSLLLKELLSRAMLEKKNTFVNVHYVPTFGRAIGASNQPQHQQQQRYATGTQPAEVTQVSPRRILLGHPQAPGFFPQVTSILEGGFAVPQGYDSQLHQPWNFHINYGMVPSVRSQWKLPEVVCR